MMPWLALALFDILTLYDQSTERVLTRRFQAEQVSWIVASAASGGVIASKWTDQARPIPVGSLVKPFLARALPAAFVSRCQPERCWRSGGHGELDLKHAIAHSCNSYFRDAAERIDSDDLALILSRYGLSLPGRLSIDSRLGFGRDWTIAPGSLISGYRVLLADREASGIRSGMRLSAIKGTARLLGVTALAKTGTAPCTHTRRAQGDGFVFAAWPAEQPRYLVLVRVHNTTGANAARTGGEIIRALRDGR